MFKHLAALDSVVDRGLRPVVRLLHLRLGLSPNAVSWAAFGASIAAAVVIAAGHDRAGLGLVALGQMLDYFDGGIARQFGLASVEGARLDTLLDRASEAVIFLGFAFAGLASLKLVLLTLTAVLLGSAIYERSGLDPGFKRVVLYLGLWFPYPVLFTVIFAANLSGYVIGLLLIDLQFQHRMDALEGDFDTVASRAARLEAAERQAVQAPRSA